ncbi:MAG: hypothetical protein OXC40_01025 [Proteobacteria bacterium]|nr:hypothetical protein [Pseudomonadota bacterium]
MSSKAGIFRQLTFYVIIFCFFSISCRSVAEQNSMLMAIADESYSLSLNYVMELGYSPDGDKKPQVIHDDPLQLAVPKVRFEVCQLSTSHCINPFYYEQEGLFVKEYFFALLPHEKETFISEDPETMAADQSPEESVQSQVSAMLVALREYKTCDKKLSDAMQKVRESNQIKQREYYADFEEHQAKEENNKLTLWGLSFNLGGDRNPMPTLELEPMPGWNCDDSQQALRLLQSKIITRMVSHVNYPKLPVDMTDHFSLGEVGRSKRGQVLFTLDGPFREALVPEVTRYHGAKQTMTILKEMAYVINKNSTALKSLRYICVPNKGQEVTTLPIYGGLEGNCVTLYDS